jgi:hypothetical protein
MLQCFLAFLIEKPKIALFQIGHLLFVANQPHIFNTKVEIKILKLYRK